MDEEKKYVLTYPEGLFVGIDENSGYPYPIKSNPRIWYDLEEVTSFQGMFEKENFELHTMDYALKKVDAKKPRLYLDIDGVIYGWYGGQWQVRPYTASLIHWANKHFDVKWLSFNGRDEMLGKVLYSEIPKTNMSHSDDEEESNLKGPWEKLRGIERDGGIEGDWLIIEDTPPTLEAYEILKEKDSLHKWILVPETGADVLLEVMIVLEQWLEKGKLRIPKYWQFADYLGKELCLWDDWKGLNKNQCEPH